MENIQDSLISIEQKVAHMERALDELNTVVYEQHKDIEDVRSENRALRTEIEKLNDRFGAEDYGDEKPPHY